MGTNNINLEKYLGLWDLFEKELKKLDLNLSSFSKKWEKKDTGEEYDYTKFYAKLKKQKARKNKIKKVQESSIKDLEEYIKYLNKDFTAETIREDETYEHWFD